MVCTSRGVCHRKRFFCSGRFSGSAVCWTSRITTTTIGGLLVLVKTQRNVLSNSQLAFPLFVIEPAVVVQDLVHGQANGQSTLLARSTTERVYLGGLLPPARHSVLCCAQMVDTDTTGGCHATGCLGGVRRPPRLAHHWQVAMETWYAQLIAGEVHTIGTHRPGGYICNTRQTERCSEWRQSRLT